MHLSDSQLFRQQAFINGEWRDANSGETIEVHNPATGELLGTVPKMGADETREAIEAADAAFAQWRQTTAKARAAILKKWTV